MNKKEFINFSNEKYDNCPLSFEEIIEFAKRNYLKNRTIVSSDVHTIMDEVELFTKLPLKRHIYKSGEDYSSWIIPPAWNVVGGYLKNLTTNTIIASYSDHPLFISPFSMPVQKILSKEELLPHVFCEPKRPDAFAYNWRYACDARMRLKDWGISIPKNKLQELSDEHQYEVFIDANIDNHGEMVIGEIKVKGTSEQEILLLADHCHPGQVNDSFSGVMMFMQVMASLAKYTDLKYTYKLLIMPETIGSAAYITANKDKLHNVKGTIFSEMVGWGDAWFIKNTREGNTFMDLVAANVSRKHGDVKLSPFFSIYGNDELMFNCVGTNIPSLSVQKYPFVEYHTSEDRPELVNREDIGKSFAIIFDMINIFENDCVFRPTYQVPFWMTRFNLFSDDVYQKDDFLKNFDIVYKYLDGKKSALEIAELIGCDFNYVITYLREMEKHGLAHKV